MVQLYYNCLLAIFVHNYYAQPIHYTDASKRCESLTDWSNPLKYYPVNTIVRIVHLRPLPSSRARAVRHALKSWY